MLVKIIFITTNFDILPMTKMAHFPWNSCHKISYMLMTSVLKFKLKKLTQKIKNIQIYLCALITSQWIHLLRIWTPHTHEGIFVHYINVCFESCTKIQAQKAYTKIQQHRKLTVYTCHIPMNIFATNLKTTYVWMSFCSLHQCLFLKLNITSDL